MTSHFRNLIPAASVAGFKTTTMTKVSVSGEQPTEQPKELKKIEFSKALCGGLLINETSLIPNKFENVMLFEKNYGHSGYDIIFAWNDIDDKIILVGHWNDGVV